MSKVISRDTKHGYKRWDLPIVEDVSAAVDNAKHGNRLLRKPMMRALKRAVRKEWFLGRVKLNIKEKY